MIDDVHLPARKLPMPSSVSPQARSALVAAAAAILLVLGGRFVSVYPLTWAFSRSRWQLPLPYVHILFWGGLRGALALALALAVPVSMPERGAIIMAAFVVVAFSIIVQGLTMPRLLRYFDLGEQKASS